MTTDWTMCRSRGRRVARATGAIIAVALLGGHPTRAQAAEDTRSAIRNGGFEEPGAPPPGWRVQNPAGSHYELVDGAMTGAKALKLVLPVAGTATLTSDPMPVTGHYGKGRVAVFAGTYLGASAEDEVLFYEWTDYPILLCRVLQWLSKP